MNYQQLTQTLVDSFNTIADEVQVLTDRKTVLEHKLRFAHEQFQYLADKHAPAAPEIAETLAKLQLPPELKHAALKNVVTVPLLKRATADASHQIALLIRDGRRAAKQLSALAREEEGQDARRDTSKATASATSSTGEEEDMTLSPRFTGDDMGSNTVTTSMSTALEQDFTVEGRKGSLACPFSAAAASKATGKDAGDQDHGVGGDAVKGETVSDPTPHHSSDPVCAAMYEETTSQPAPSKRSKCPIRYMDKHSPEEIAQYVSKHKHEIPRSHEVCVSRYQKNEESIRKLDAKYGSLVNMIQGLSQLHRPMMPVPTLEAQQEEPDDSDSASNKRVKSWAQEVSASADEFPEGIDQHHLAPDSQHSQHSPEPPRNQGDDEEAERQGHFDRPLKEIRVGESPSRPWGISVPVFEPPEYGGQQSAPVSPPPAPVVTNSIHSQQQQSTPRGGAGGKCPFDHTKFAMFGAASGLGQVEEKSSVSGGPPPPPSAAAVEHQHHHHHHHQHSTTTPEKQDQRPAQSASHQFAPQPTFVNAPERTGSAPQMVFTGPVFIGYPIDQAIQFMQQYQGGRS